MPGIVSNRIATRASRCALSPGYVLALLAPQHDLVVQIAERTLRIVLRLERGVRGAVVDRPELVVREVGFGIQRLDTAQLGDLALDLAVVEAARARPLVAHDIPEAEVDVQRVGRERIQRKAHVGRRRLDRTDPYRQDADLGMKEVEELRGARERNID